MIKNLLTKIATIFGAVLTIFTIGRFFGKKSEETKQIKESFNDAIKSKKRQENRKNDDISVVKRRMQKYIRK
jgi:predicted tellurium resistance membrane protein TerC